jgi:Xaa-Pro aminopeptidase
MSTTADLRHRTVTPQETREHDEKLDRLTRLAHAAGVDGILLAAHHNIAWLTSGRHNRVDGSREAGSARLLVTADGHRYVLANAIEMPRMLDEVLFGLDYSPIEYSWTDDQDPAHAVRAAAGVVKTGTGLAADWPLPETRSIEPLLMRGRAALTDGELARYRTLGRDAGLALGNVCRALTPGDTEQDIARSIIDAAAGVRARAVVALVGADERLRRYRHPVATSAAWKQVVMVALCAERDGLTVSLSRIVAAAAIPELEARTRAAASVFGRALAATRPGTAAPQLYDTFVRAYADAGYPGEEVKHHQGGAIGYRAREWVAHPRSQEIVEARQAFAWNPTVTGTKVEDTALVVGDRVDIITSTPDWPSIEIDGHLRASGVWRL